MKNLARNLLLIALLFGFAACVKKSVSGGKPANVDYYTCTMHPSVKSQDPDGKCPICSMDLVPVMKRGSDGSGGAKSAQPMAEMEARDAKPNEFFVAVERQQQIGVTYATVERRPLHRVIRAVGTIAPDVSRDWQFVARVDGYVQKLYVTSPGQMVEKDAPLMSIYSPDLLTSERELAQLLHSRDNAAVGEARDMTAKLIQAAESRLRQWNMTDAQIAVLEKSRTPSENLTLLSPFRGFVQSVPVTQGKAVKVGDALAEVVDLSVVWVWAQFYEEELSALKEGQKVIVTVNAYPGEHFAGEIALISPFVDEMKRTSRARIDIPNPEFKLHPGMYSDVKLGINMGEGLTIPVSAVMPTGERDIAFVDKGEGKLEPRILQLAGKFGDLYEVREGLKEGERVVASANFLIDAESKIQGALKDFEEPVAAKPTGAQ